MEPITRSLPARTAPRRLASFGALAGAGVLLLAACGGGSSSSYGGGAQPSSGAPPASSAAPQSPGGASQASGGGGTAVTVTETDYHLALSRTTFTPGTYTFTADDQGAVSHALEIDGPGVSDQKTGTVMPGGTAELTVTLHKGSYELYCPIPGHRDLGMQTTIKVA